MDDIRKWWGMVTDGGEARGREDIFNMAMILAREKQWEYLLLSTY